MVMLLMFQSTSSIILSHFEMLVKTHPVIIYFLTMLVGAGGNAGGQSTVLVVRKLALLAVKGGTGEVTMGKIVCQELSVGARLAILLCAASFVRCLAFQVLGLECLAICLSMLAIVASSCLVGAALPVMLDRLGMDPAHAGATIQVVMDISGVTVTCLVSCFVLGLPVMGAQAAQDPAVRLVACGTTFLTQHTSHLRGAQGMAAAAAATASNASSIVHL